MEKVLVAAVVLFTYSTIAIAVRLKVYRDVKKISTPRLRVHFAKQLESRAKSESIPIALLWPILYPIWFIYKKKQMRKEFLMYDTIKYIFG